MQRWKGGENKTDWLGSWDPKNNVVSSPDFFSISCIPY